VYDIRKLDEAEQVRESPIKAQTRAIRAVAGGAGFAVASIEGRVAIEYLDLAADAQAKKFAFKCHRRKVGETENVYPVNTLATHPVHGTLATGGCDGFVCVWDLDSRRRVSQFHQYPSSVAAVDFNHDGSLLAVASSYTFEQGDQE
jgi:cell cycle arrest protein BUB3